MQSFQRITSPQRKGLTSVKNDFSSRSHRGFSALLVNHDLNWIERQRAWGCTEGLDGWLLSPIAAIDSREEDTVTIGTDYAFR